MATQTIQFAFLAGQTVTVKLFADDGSDTVLATPTATEATNRTGVYSFTQTDRAAGNYLLTVSATGINAEYSLPLTLATATFWAVERANVTHISGDSSAADNAESFFDGTGYAGTGNTFPKLDDIHAKLPTRAYMCGSTVNSGAIDATDRAAISDAVYDDLFAEHVEEGSFGLLFQSIVSQVAFTLALAHGSGSWGTATGFSTLTALDVRTALGMATNNLDVQLGSIKIDTAVARSAGVVQIGIISNAGTAVESYTYGGQTVTFAGLDTSGNRSGVTVS